MPGYRFMHAGIPAIVRSISEKRDYACFTSDDGSESGTISMGTLVAIINHNH